jgi:hypothetical protein
VTGVCAPEGSADFWPGEAWFRVEWTGAEGPLFSHDLPQRDALVMAETLRRAGRRDAVVHDLRELMAEVAG